MEAKTNRDDVLRQQLIDKSVEAYIHALETINRISIAYRVEAFSFLICNAWEMLLKAKLLSDGESVYYPPPKDNRTLSLRDCLKKHFKDNDPTRRNIERIETIRDEAVHFVISSFPREMLAIFQTCVINFNKHLKEWANYSLGDRLSLGMMTIVYEFDSQDINYADVAVQERLGAKTAHYLAALQSEIREEWDSLGKSSEYSINFNFTLALVEKTQDGDIILTSGVSGERMGVVVVAKDASISHPYRQKEAIQEINRRLNGVRITTHNIQCIIRVYNVKNRADYCYKSRLPGNNTPQYSLAFVEWVVSQYNKDNQFFTWVQERANQERKKEALGMKVAQNRSYKELVDVIQDESNPTSPELVRSDSE